MMTPETAVDFGKGALASDGSLAGSSLSPDELRDVFRNHAAGVALITADTGEGPVALTATSVFSVSATPPLLVFSVSELSSAAPTIAKASSAVVHFLAAGQLDLAKLGATSGVDRFADRSSWNRLPTGEPYFLAARTWVRGTIVNRFEAGSSTLVVVHATHTGHPAAASTDAEAEDVAPLVYHNRTWHHLGEHSAL